jgi:hypothetical protein
MSERAEKLRKELTALYVERVFGDPGLTLTQPTHAQKEDVRALVAKMPLGPVLPEVAVLLAGLVADAVEQKGLRPADYWREGLEEALAARVAKALEEPPKEFGVAFRTVLRGRG